MGGYFSDAPCLCLVCGHVAINEIELQRHAIRRHNASTGIYICGACAGTFRRFEDEISHNCPGNRMLN